MSGGWYTHAKSTRLFLTWEPGADIDHQKRLEVTQYVAGEMDKFCGNDQFKYDDLITGIINVDPGAHMYMEGVLKRACDMAGGKVHVWVAVTIIPDAGKNTEPVKLNIGATELCESLTFESLMKGDENDGEI